MDTTKKMRAVYTVVQKSDGKDVWLRIGAAFPNRDGSLSVLLDAVPMSGRLQIREHVAKDAGEGRARESRRRESEGEGESNGAEAV